MVHSQSPLGFASPGLPAPSLASPSSRPWIAADSVRESSIGPVSGERSVLLTLPTTPASPSRFLMSSAESRCTALAGFCCSHSAPPRTCAANACADPALNEALVTPPGGELRPSMLSPCGPPTAPSWTAIPWNSAGAAGNWKGWGSAEGGGTSRAVFTCPVAWCAYCSCAATCMPWLVNDMAGCCCCCCC
eukprot:3392484-Rhodomonas_salina.1